MNDETWLNHFDASKASFKWFFIQYGFENEWNRLEELRKRNQVKRMKHIMNTVWSELPETVFNSKMNPEGWSNFIALLN